MYGINTLDPDTGHVVLGYVGQTFQALAARDAQHREDQPWADLIVGEAFVIKQGWWTCAEVDQVEAAYIRGWRPVYNHEHNLDNPDRVPIWLARKQRARRDAAAGRPAWIAPSGIGRARRRWPRWAVRLAWRAAVWLAVAIVVFVAVPDSTSFGAAVEASVLGASVALTATWARRGRRRR